MAIDRRAFVALAGLVALPVACTARRSVQPARTTVVPLPSSIAPAPAPTSASPIVVAHRRAITTLTELSQRMSGRVVRATDRDYATARLAFNPIYDGQHPAAIAQCRSVPDVQRCVEFAAASRVAIAARSGGHSYAGYSTPPAGLVVDVGALNAVSVRADGTAVIGAGARLIDVYSALARAGRCLPAGSCPTVGIAGLTLGGGIGYLTRKFGLTCDRLLAADVVLADGSLAHASAASQADMFWALRGGGGGNVGIVTSFTFRTDPAPPMVKFELSFPAGTVPDVLGAWQHWIARAPNDLTAGCVITASDAPSCVVAGAFAGSITQAQQHIAALIGSAGVTPDASTVLELDYEQAMYDFAYCANLSQSQCAPDWTALGHGLIGRNAFVGTSRILQAPVDSQALTDAVAGSDTTVLLDPLGGAVKRMAAGASAFAHRDALATVQIYGSERAAVDTVRTSLGTLLGQHGYVNYIDPTMPEWRAAYYGANYRRLRRVAQSYDPDRVFAFPQNVG